MLDQASKLRELVLEKINKLHDYAERTMKNEQEFMKIIAIASGKGGVGKSNVAINVGIALMNYGKKVTILDADFGLANIDILLGLIPEFNLYHVLFGEKSLKDILVDGPRGIKIIPAGSGIKQLAELTDELKQKLLRNFGHLNYNTDILIIDTAAGISSNVIDMLMAAGDILIITTPEPTAITDAYSIIKVILNENSNKKIKLVVNSAKTSDEAEQVFGQINSAVEKFLKSKLEYIGFVYQDQNLVKSVRQQKAVIELYPNSTSSKCFHMIAKKILDLEAKVPRTGFLNFFKNLLLKVRT
jgi:flagellar biosynthesis protein FlhG